MQNSPCCHTNSAQFARKTDDDSIEISKHSVDRLRIESVTFSILFSLEILANSKKRTTRSLVAMTATPCTNSFNHWD